MPTPEELLDRIDSPAAFLGFLRALRAEHQASIRREQEEPPDTAFGRGVLGWENVTLPAFLEAMEAWGADAGLPEHPSWRLVAQLLVAGKGYE